MTKTSLHKTSTDDRASPRPLTRRELQACWEEMPSDPSAREDYKDYMDNNGVDEVLPKHALLTIPKTFPVLRTSYDLLPSKTLLLAQYMRTFKLSVIKDAVLTSSNGFKYADGVDIFHHLLGTRMTSEGKMDSVPLPDFHEIYETAQELKARANDCYTSGGWLEALGTYGRAWMTMLPYHIFAFPSGDRRAFLLGELDTTIFNNITATCLDTYRKSRSPNPAQPYKLSEALGFKIVSMGFNSGMAAAHSHHAGMMTVGATLKLSRRLLEIHEYIQAPSYRAYGHPGLPKYMVEHHKYVIEHLTDKPAKMLLFEAAPGLKERIESLDRWIYIRRLSDHPND
ncbi:hypothetical protein IAT40_002472 [Kwoniella sp. CBS 6097]